MSSIDSREVVTEVPLTNAELFNSKKEPGKKFAIETLKYPSNLNGEDGEFKHWISFNINVRGKSKLRLPNESISGQIKRGPDSAQLTEDQLSVAKTAALGLGGAAGGVAAGAIVNELSQKYIGRNQTTGGGDLSPSTLRRLAAGGAVVGAVASIASDYLKADTTYRLSDSISLFVDGPPTVKYNAQYNNKDLGTVAGMVGGLSGAGSALGSYAAEAGSAMALKMAQLPQMFGGTSATDLVGASAKVALNPFKEVLFESIDFRAFNFKYKFMPKSRQEAESVYNIIEKFKFHMHPELSSNKLFFIYPSEFQISYHFQNKENNKNNNGYFHKFKPCVLESMEVSYGSDQFTSFPDGRPSEINLTLTFRETEILTKQQILQGY